VTKRSDTRADITIEVQFHDRGDVLLDTSLAFVRGLDPAASDRWDARTFGDDGAARCTAAIQAACSPTADPEPSPAEEPGSNEASHPTDDAPPAEGDPEDLEDLSDVEVDRNLLGVDITIPASFFEGEDPQDIIDSAEQEGIGETTVNPDGSVTYRMSRAQHRELLDELRVSITEGLDEMVVESTSIQAIDHDDELTEFNLIVDRPAYEDSLDSFAILGIAIGAGYYQLFSGSDPDSYRVVVNSVDADTDETFDTFIIPDDWE